MARRVAQPVTQPTVEWSFVGDDALTDEAIEALARLLLAVADVDEGDQRPDQGKCSAYYLKAVRERLAR
jgi:hypothetical protein